MAISEPTTTEIKQIYADVIDVICKGNCGFGKAEPHRITENVMNIVDSAIEDIQRCSKNLSTIEGWMWSVFYPKYKVQKALRTLIKDIYNIYVENGKEGVIKEDIQKWLNELNKQYKNCILSAFNKYRTDLGMAMLGI